MMLLFSCTMHCVKSVRIQSFSGPYSVRMRENFHIVMMFPMIRVFPQKLHVYFIRLTFFVILYYHQCIKTEGGIN